MRTGLRLLIAVVFVLTAAQVARAQEHSKRLILKDGSYQAITEYKVQGDRVHYFSAERYDWEDIPNALIDWDATNKYNANPVKNDTSREERDTAEEEERETARSETEAPTVASRLRLPDAATGGVYLLDEWRGRPELAEIVQNGADTGDQGDKKFVLRNPLAIRHQSFTLSGAHARVQSHVARPTIYLCIEAGDEAVDENDHFRIVRVQSDVPRNTRSVGTLNVKLSGKTSETEKFVPSSASKVNHGPWVMINPNEPLPPGEYAVVEMLSEGEINLYVWDFGVNPNAAENVNTIQPAETGR